MERFEKTSDFEAYPAELQREIEKMDVENPFQLFRNGSIKTNMFFKPQMSGYFTVDVQVFDFGGKYDNATLRVRIVLRKISSIMPC